MTQAKPFLKWAGGKTQLLPEIQKLIPTQINQIDTYIEPFIGSGAVLFHILNTYPEIKNVVINDINPDLINTYRIIANKPHELFPILEQFQNEYHELENKPDLKKEYYYQKRAEFNLRVSDLATHAALFIFLNRTCFNGLYRVNSKNEFNVPIGSYKKPTIYDRTNLEAVHAALKKVEILCGQYQNTLDHATGNTFFYFDPPYKPLTNTAAFNSYAKDSFGDEQQIELATFCRQLNNQGYTWVLSNSDMKNVNEDDCFFDDLYQGFNIKRVLAKRTINSNASKRGQLNELLITNQKT